MSIDTEPEGDKLEWEEREELQKQAGYIDLQNHIEPLYIAFGGTSFGSSSDTQVEPDGWFYELLSNQGPNWEKILKRIEQFPIKAKVTHKIFGDGTILGNDGEHIIVSFANRPTPVRLSLEYAPIRLSENN